MNTLANESTAGPGDYKLNEFDSLNSQQAIEEFVNLLEIKNKKEIIDYTLGLYEKSKL